MLAHVVSDDRTFHDEMITAVGEAFNNIAIHGYGGRSDGMVQVEADLEPGRGYGPADRHRDRGRFLPIGSPDLGSMPESGMGVFLIHALVDKVEYQRGTANILSLTKRTSAPPTSR